MEPKKSVGLAVASMVLGIVAVVLNCCFYYLSIPCGLVGLILGAIALSKISQGTAGGKGMAITGVVLSIISLALCVVVIATAGAILAELGSYGF